MSKGVIYSAYGERAIKEAKASIASVKRSNPGLAVCVITDKCSEFSYDSKITVHFDSDPYGREAKLAANILSPFDDTLYLDADTRVYGDLSLPFRLLESGFEFIATLSVNQESRWLNHLPASERNSVLDEIGFYSVVIQGGVWAFRKTDATKNFFRYWREAYLDAGELEQGALQRAYHKQAMKSCIIGKDWNGGGIVRHNYGMARRTDV